MQKYLGILKKISLFDGIKEDELLGMLKCLNASVRSFERGAFLLRAEDPIRTVGIVLTGSAEVVREDAFGRRSLVARLEPTDMFGEALVAAGQVASPVSVQAAEVTYVLFIDYGRIVGICTSACAFHNRLVINMLKILAQKNLGLMKKLDYAALRGMREKLSAYLLDTYAGTGAKRFEIPFNREQLADYLSVDRSAMSRELCRMRDEGLIAFNRNRFEILREI